MTLTSTGNSSEALYLGWLRNLIRGIIPSGEFLRNIRTLVTGTLFSQLLLIAVSPVLTRIYAPEDFGKLAVFSGITTILTVFATMRYHYALVMAEDEEEAATLADLCLRISMVVASIFFVGVLLFQWVRISSGDEFQLGWIALLIPIAIIVSGRIAVLSNWCNRREAYRAIANGAVSQSVASSSFNVAAGLVYPSGITLALGLLFSQLANGFALKRGLLRSNKVWGAASRQLRVFGSSRDSLISAARKFKKFPQYSLWSDLANVGSAQFALLAIAAFFAEPAAGFLMLAQRVVGLPMTFIGNAIGQVFYRQASELNSQPEELSQLLRKLYRTNLLIGLVPTTVLIFYGDVLFEFAFGPEWRSAGMIAQFVAPAFLFQFVSSPLSSIFWVDNNQQQFLLFCSTLLLGRVASILIPVFLGMPFYTTVLCFGITSTAIWLGFALLILSQRIQCLLPILVETLAAVLFAGGIGFLSRYFFQTMLLTF